MKIPLCFRFAVASLLCILLFFLYMLRIFLIMNCCVFNGINRQGNGRCWSACFEERILSEEGKNIERYFVLYLFFRSTNVGSQHMK